MNRPPAGSLLLLAALVGACRSPAPPPNEAEVALGRARSLSAAGDKAAAAESLANCQTLECLEQKSALAKAALEGFPAGEFADEAAAQRFLRLERLSGASAACALILAIARAPAVEKAPAGEAVRRTVAAALTQEIDRLKTGLQKRELPEVDLNNALDFGAAIADDTGCEALETVRARLDSNSAETRAALGDPSPGFPGQTAAQLGDAAALGLLTAKLEQMSARPNPPAGKGGKDRKDGSSACREAAPLNLNQSCKTSRGVTITRVKRGKALGMVVKNKFWSDVLDGSFENYKGGQAETACAALGLRLPSRADFELLRDSFEVQLDSSDHQRKFTKTGRLDFLGALPSTKEHVLWSSTRQKGASADALTFLPEDAIFTYVTPELDHAVSCVGSAK